MWNMDFVDQVWQFSVTALNIYWYSMQIQVSGNWILLSVHGYSDGIIDTTGINKFSLVKCPLMTILYYKIKFASPCLFMLQVLHRSIMPYHSAWHYIFLYVSCLYCFFFSNVSNLKSNISAKPKQVTSILHISCGFA